MLWQQGRIAGGFVQRQTGCTRREKIQRPANIVRKNDSSNKSLPGNGKDQSIEDRIATLPWDDLQTALSATGLRRHPALLTPAECAATAQPLPSRGTLSQSSHHGAPALWPRRLPIFRQPAALDGARTANSRLSSAGRGRKCMGRGAGTKGAFPQAHTDFLEQCHRAGQKRPTPLLLHYEQDGYNCLHQDIYGAVTFPLQMVCLLGQQGRDWQGGEFVLVEQRPRAQSRAEVMSPDEGCAVIFTTRYRPVQGSKGYYRVNMKHGVARVRSGQTVHAWNHLPRCGVKQIPR